MSRTADVVDEGEEEEECMANKYRHGLCSIDDDADGPVSALLASGTSSQSTILTSAVTIRCIFNQSSASFRNFHLK